MPKWWDRFVVVATFGAVFLVVYWEIFDVDPEVDPYLVSIDLTLCTLFIVDFFVRLSRAKGFRLRFVGRNWPDLLGAIPFYGPFRALRVVRVLRVVRLIALGRRMIRRYDLPLLPTATFAYLFLVVGVVWFGAAAIFFELESPTNPGIETFDDALWWSMTTLSTVGYGDTYPSTTAGRAVAMVTMVFGVGVLGTLAATIAAGLVEMRERGVLGLGKFRMKNHLLILGWNDRSDRALRELKRDRRHTARSMLIVAQRERSPVDNVDFVRGEPGRAEVLERAGAAKASAALVFARDPQDPRSDHETALIALAFRRLNPQAILVAELVSPGNREHFQAADCDTLVDGASLVADLLVRSVSEVGVDRVVDRFVRPGDGRALYQVEASRHRGRSWKETAIALLDDGFTLVAVGRGRQVIMTPDDAAFRVAEGDDLFVFGRERN